jgi:hypothetical protein
VNIPQSNLNCDLKTTFRADAPTNKGEIKIKMQKHMLVFQNQPKRVGHTSSIIKIYMLPKLRYIILQG